LAGLDRYWESLALTIDAIAVYLEKEEWLDEPLTPARRSHSSSWIVLAGRAERERW